MNRTIFYLAEEILGLGEWAFEEPEIENGHLHLCACVKAYGDGWTDYYDSRDGSGHGIDKAPAFVDAVRRRFPEIKSVSITIHHD